VITAASFFTVLCSQGTSSGLNCSGWDARSGGRAVDQRPPSTGNTHTYTDHDTPTDTYAHRHRHTTTTHHPDKVCREKPPENHVHAALLAGGALTRARAT
jgi:hypothetical protein